MRYYLGIDVGATKTHALIADENGCCLGFGTAWGGNHQGVGYEGLVNALQESFEQACQGAAVSPDKIAGSGFGVAGYDFPSDHQPHLEAIARLGVDCPFEIVNDGLNGLYAGADSGIGVNVTAGTSVNVRGRGPNGEEGRIVGNGSAFGEFGGGMEIVWKGLHMVNYAWIQRIPPTALTGIYLDATGAKDILDLMEGLSNQNYHLFPYLAIQVFETAKAGDQAAIQVLHWAGEELGWLAVAVARQIGMADQAVQVIQSGGIFEGGKLITEPMNVLVMSHLPRAKLKRLECPPVIGPVVLGMLADGLDGFSLRDRLIESAQGIVR